jgi:hypothetical protein
MPAVDVLFTVLYTLVFGFLLGMGVQWLRHPHRLETFLRGTVFEDWTWWLVPWMTWGFVVVGGLGLGFQVWGWFGLTASGVLMPKQEA